MGNPHNLAIATRQSGAPIFRVCSSVPIARCLSQFLCIAALLSICLVCPALAGWPDDYDPEYVEAVENTSGTVPNDVVRESHDLAHVGDGRMEWSGERLVMTMLTDFAGYDRNYTDSRFRPEVWVAPVGETSAFFQEAVGQVPDLELRYRQYMGMPSNHSDDRIVEVLIHPDMLFRPAEDTRIDSSSLGDGRDTSQYEKVSELYPTFDQWWANQMHTYDPTSNPPYPWTRLGYTYDWGGSPEEIVGSSEFIVKRWGTGSTWLRDGAGNWYQAAFNVPGAEYALSVQAVVPTTAYPYYVRSGPEIGNFLVAGDCKTIWAGDRFTPVGSVAPLVDIAAGAVVSNGILIDDSDIHRTFQLTSRGSILGGLYGPDKTVRNHSIEFCSSARFDNQGLVVGESIAVRADGSRGPMDVQNSGTLWADQYAALLSSFDDTFWNSGIVDGDVAMGGGDDTVVLVGGDIQGDLDGGTHDDGDQLTVEAEGPVHVAGEVRGFEQNLVSRASNSSDGAFILNGTLTGNVLLGTSGDGFLPGRLGGNFLIDGNLDTQSGAGIAPGSSLGAGQITGDYTQAAGAALEMEVARTAGNQLVSDTLTVTGTARFADGAEVHVLREPTLGELPLRQGNSFVLLQAGLLDLAAVPVCLSESAVLDFQCVGSGNELLLVVDDVREFADQVSGERNRAIAGALDADLATAGGAYAGMLAELQFASTGTLNGELDSIRPDAYQAFDRAVRLVTCSMHERLSEGTLPGCGEGMFPSDQAAPAADDSTERSSGKGQLSIEPFGLFQNEGSSSTIGYGAESVGFLLHGNRWITDRLMAGVVFGYADLGVDLSDNSGYASAALYRIGPYAAVDLAGWRLHSAATFGYHDYNTGRTAGSLGNYDAAYSTSDGSIYFDVRRPRTNAGWDLSPLGSLQYTFGGREALAETTTGPAAFTFSPWNSDSLRSRLGACIGRTINASQLVVCPAITAGWAHEFLSDERTGVRFSDGGSEFYLPSDAFLQNAGFLRTALSVCGPRRMETALAYEGQWGPKTTAHGGTLSLTARY